VLRRPPRGRNVGADASADEYHRGRGRNPPTMGAQGSLGRRPDRRGPSRRRRGRHHGRRCLPLGRHNALDGCNPDPGGDGRRAGGRRRGGSEHPGGGRRRIGCARIGRPGHPGGGPVRAPVMHGWGDRLGTGRDTRGKHRGRLLEHRTRSSAVRAEALTMSELPTAIRTPWLGHVHRASVPLIPGRHET
jgi:hypothetical protein